LGDRAQAHPPIPATDQRQDRTFPPHPGRWLGLRPLLRVHRRPQRATTAVVALLQSASSPLRPRRKATGHPTDQPPWTSQLAVTVLASSNRLADWVPEIDVRMPPFFRGPVQAVLWVGLVIGLIAVAAVAGNRAVRGAVG